MSTVHSTKASTSGQGLPDSCKTKGSSLATDIISDIDKIEAVKRMRKDAEAQQNPAPTPHVKKGSK